MNRNVFWIVLSLLLLNHRQCIGVRITTQVHDKLRSIAHWLDSRPDTTVFDYIYRVNRGAGLNLFQGDIKGYNPKSLLHRTAIRNHQMLWNTRVVPYYIDSGFDAAGRQAIIGAIDEYHYKTCIRFVPRTTETDFIHFKEVSGCYSNIGRTGGDQEISLTGPCLIRGTAVHEIMHALGFWHEQSRPDRDSWIQVIYGNIQAGKEYNFDKLSTNEVDTLGVQYDYGSVMHYSKYAFTKNGNPTILPSRPTGVHLGQRDGLSVLDVKRINTIYRCDIQLPTKAPPTTKPPPKTQPPTTKPPTTKPPPTQPPQTKPPQTQPPATQPPPTKPPQTHPPATKPPTQPPSTKPTTTKPPITAPPPTKPPVTQPAPTKPRPTNPPLGWTPWSQWTACNLECQRSRYRFCLNYDSKYCPGQNSETESCPYACQSAVAVGCWKDDPKTPLIPSAEGLNSALVDSYKKRTAADRKCANYAASQGYIVFALTDGGKCLTGPTAHVDFSKHGASRECGNTGVGGPSAISVYSFQANIDGQWSLWTEWGQCTKTCGSGLQYRFRRCDNPPVIGSGKGCNGNSQEYKICNIFACNENAKCDRQYHTGGPGTSGVIWVRSYDNFMECDYQILSYRMDSTISIFIQQIDIEYSNGCIYDSLMLYDGSSVQSPLVGSFCGSQAPGTFESTSNVAYLRFQSDESNTGRGYTVFYTINSRSRKSCIQPPPGIHVKMYGTGNMVGDRVYCRCDPGYKMVGNSPITCLDQPGFALWDDFFPRCVKPSRKRSVRIEGKKQCTFAESLCGFQQDNSDDFDWFVVQANATATQLQTPTADHTSGGGGHFLHAKSSLDREPGDTARVSLPLLWSYTNTKCLRFWYRLYGGEFASLNIYTLRNNNTDYVLNVWSVTGSDADTETDWVKAEVELLSTQGTKVVFEAVLGDEYGSSASIDDVSVVNGSCA